MAARGGGPIHVLDDFYLSITLLVTIGYQLLFFSIAFALKFDKLTDFAGGTNFILLAALTLGLSSSSTPPTLPDTRQIVTSTFLILWAARLSGFLFFRVLRTGKDDRFDDKRDKLLPFLGFWTFQALWVWTVSLPVTLLNSPAVRSLQQSSSSSSPPAAAGRPNPPNSFGTGRDIAGVVLFAVGFVMESVADVQKFVFREKRRNTTTTTTTTTTTEGGEKKAVLDSGFWYVSRHPNYFGEILVQFGIYTIAVSAAANDDNDDDANFPSLGTHPPGYRALTASIVGAFLLTALLLFVSGIPLSERPAAKKRYERGGESWEAYKRYLDRTSVLIPCPPQLYSRFPVFVKRTLFLEFPMYVFDPAKHAGDDAEAGNGNGSGPGTTTEEEGEGGERRSDVRRQTSSERLTEQQPQPQPHNESMT